MPSQQPHQDWMSLFNDKIKIAWELERPELKKISMIYNAFEDELNRLKTDLNQELSQMKTELKRKDVLLKCKNFNGLAQSEYFIDVCDTNKENETPSIEPLTPLYQNEELFIESPNTSTFYNPSRTAKVLKSPILNKNRLIPRKNLASPSLLFPALGHRIERTPETNQTVKTLKTPKLWDDPNILESTIIEDTPDLKISKRSKLSLQMSKKRKKNNNVKGKTPPKKPNSTLTQMFFEPKGELEMDSNAGSMSITEVLDLINKEENKDRLDDDDDATIDSLDIPEEEKREVDDLASFVEKYNKIPERKVQEPFEIRRGNDRKKLKGWSCKDCENYYKGLNLPYEELEKKMNACSKHRSSANPVREDTFAGFWDLTFGPTPQT